MENEALNEKPQANFTARFILIAAVLLLVLGVITFQMIRIGLTGSQYRERATEKIIQDRVITPRLGNIYSSDGYLLAATVLKYNIYWDITVPKDAAFRENLKPICRTLARILPTRSQEQWERYFTRARSAKNRYVHIAESTEQAVVDSLRTIPLFQMSKFRSGLIIESNDKRIKPMKGLADRLIGISDDDKGYVGVEGGYSNLLRGEPGMRTMQRIKGEWKPLFDGNKKDPVEGKDLVLTINASLQDAAKRSLYEVLAKHEADHGSVVIMEVKSGAIRVMANLGRLSDGTYAEIQNYAVGELNDPGSTFKLASFLAALEDGVADTSRMYDTENGVYTIYDRHVRDSKIGGYGVISVGKAFVKSSNTATVKMIYDNYKNNPERFVNRIYKMGLNQKTGINIPGEPEPYIPNPSNRSKWSGISLPWMAFGYEVMLTPLQMLCFYNAVANDGEYIRPTIVEKIMDNGKVVYRSKPEKMTTVASMPNIRKMQDLMRRVVTDSDGTAHNLDKNVMQIAGKTGTAQWGYGRGERIQYVASFAGYFPYENPQYSVIITINRPRGYNFYGSSLAAPLAGTMAREIFSKTFNEVVIDENIDKKLAEAYPASQASQYNGKNMPSVVGKYAMDVIPELEKMGLKVKLVGGIGRISSQSPQKGAIIRAGGRVTLTAVN